MPEADALDRMLEVDRQMALAAEIEHPLRRLPEHLRPGLRAYLAEWGKMWSRGGPLADIGLVASPDDVMARNTQALTQFPTLTAADFQ